MNEDRAFLRWQEIRQNQLTYVNDILILLATGLFGFQIQFGFNSAVQIAPSKVFFIISMIFIFVSIITGIFVAWNRLFSFRKTSEIARNREKINGECEIRYSDEDIQSFKEKNKTLRAETKKLDKTTWISLTLQICLFSFGAIVLFIFSLLEMI